MRAISAGRLVLAVFILLMGMTFRARGEEPGAWTLLWWEPRGSSTVRFATRELSAYFTRLGGREIVARRSAALERQLDAPESLGGVIVVMPGEVSEEDINSAALSRVAIDSLHLKDDGFSIRKVDGQLFLVGKNPRAVLYGAYELLETLGVRFFAPTFAFYRDHSEYVPDRRTFSLPEIDVQSEPDLARRSKYVGGGWSYTVARIGSIADWMAKAKLNTFVFPYNLGGHGRVRWDDWRQHVIPKLQERGIVIEVGGHGYQSFLPERRYAHDHPDWFVKGATVFNIANRRALATYVENVVRYLERRPEIEIFDAWPPDYARWPRQVIDRFGSEANAQAFLIEKLRRRARDRVPSVRIQALAYENRKYPPDPEYAFHPSVLIDMAVQGRSYAVTITGHHARNAEYARLVRQWKSEFDGGFGIYEYYRKMSWHSLPVVLPQIIVPDIRFYRDLGVDGLGIYAEPGDWITYEPVHLLVAAASWDSDLTASAFMDDYIKARYEALSEGMASYFSAVEVAGRQLFDRMRGNYRNLEAVSRALSAYQQARRLLMESLGEQGPHAAKFMIERLLWNASFSIADTSISFQELLGHTRAARRAKLRTKVLVERHASDGIIVENRWVTRRYR
jgi:Domain of unknown function (DUF4838)/Glycosyl hydrolase family 67 N-terminus